MLVLPRQDEVLFLKPFQERVQKDVSNSSSYCRFRIGMIEDVLRRRDELGKVCCARRMLKPGMCDFMGDDGAYGTLVQHDQQLQADRHRELPLKETQKPPPLADRRVQRRIDQEDAA